ncbi:MAG: LysM peptidoglycan-binding domain-containing protein [Myxococcota bacterium]
MPRSHRTSKPRSSTPPSTTDLQPDSAQEEESSGFMGFLQRTGRAIGDGYDSAKSTVGGWVDAAGEAVGDVADSAKKWGHTIGEASDLDYDIGWGDISATGSLKDILEIGVAADAIPADLLRILEGATASNVITLHYDYGAGTLSIDAADLQVNDVLVSGMHVGTANLQGVHIGVTSDKIEIIGSERHGSTAEVTALKCEALDVRYDTSDGPMQAERLLLEGLVMRASSRKGEILEGDVTGSIHAAGAAVEGFSGAGVEVESGRIGMVSAEVAEGGESAAIRLGSVDAHGVTQGGVSLGSAGAEDVRVDVTNAGGGMVGVDDKADHLAADVTVKAATVREFSHPMASLSSGALDQARVQYGEGGTSATLSGVHASGLDTSWADAEGIDAEGLSVQHDAAGTRGGLQGVRATGLSAEQGGASGVSVSDVRFAQGAAGTEASVGNVRADGVHSDQGGARSVTIGGGSVSLTDAGGSATLGAVDVRGASAPQGSADRATIAPSSGRWTGSGDTLSASGRLGAVTAQGLHSEWADAAKVEAAPVSVAMGGGHTRIGTSHVGATGVSGSDVAAASLDADRISADLGPNGAVSAKVGEVRADTLAAYGATVGGARLTDTDVAMGADGTNVSLGGLDVTAARYGDVAAADRLTANQAHVGIRSATDLDASLGDVRIPGLQASNFAAGDVRGAGIGVDMDRGRTEARVASASLADATVADRIHVGSGDVSGVTASVAGSDVRGVTLDSASVRDVRDSVTGSTASSASLEGVDFSNSPDKMRASVDHLAVGGANFDSGRIPASGGSSGGSSGPGVNMDALIRSASQRVDDADVRFDVGVNPYSSFFADVRPGTHAQGRITAHDNQLTDVNVGLTRPIDGPLWIEGNGVYTDDKGRLRADLSGWYDHKVGGFVNDALGIQGNRLPSIAQVGSGVANQMAKPSAPSSGGSDSAPVDLDSSRVAGQVGLSPGRIEAGAGRVDLARQRAGDNVVSFDSSGGKDLAVAFSRILASGISADTGDSSISTGRTAVSGGSVRASVGDSSRVRGKVDGVDVSGLSYVGPGTAQPWSPGPPTTSPRPQARPADLAPAPQVASYTVRSGDTLSKIARRNGTTVAALASANGIADPNRIQVGQVLRLP